MSSLISLSLCLSDIDKTKITEGKNGKKYLSVTASINDEPNQWGQNASLYHSQSKEEREDKADRAWLGNGKVVWTDGTINAIDKDGNVVGGIQQVPQQQAQPAASAEGDDDLPF